jgi:hypothetical protein
LGHPGWSVDARRSRLNLPITAEIAVHLHLLQAQSQHLLAVPPDVLPAGRPTPGIVTIVKVVIEFAMVGIGVALLMTSVTNGKKTKGKQTKGKQAKDKQHPGDAPPGQRRRGSSPDRDVRRTEPTPNTGNPKDAPPGRHDPTHA